MRLAKVQTVRSIDFAPAGIAGTGSLSPRARRALHLYIVLVKMAYDGVAAPLGAIADAMFRSSNGESSSIRTLQRANTELSKRGFIRIASCRTGERSKGALIWFNAGAFSYWMQRKTGTVTPIPTVCGNSTDATTCRTSEVTTNRSCVTSENYGSYNKQPRAGARAGKNARPRKPDVLFSVGKVLDKRTDLPRADRRAARARVEIELKAAAAGVELLNPSGIDWPYWCQRWGEFSIAARESTVSRELLPRLLGTPSPAELPITAAELPITAEQIRNVRKDLEQRLSLPSSASNLLADGARPAPAWDKNDPDFAVLVAARTRARARAVNGE